MYQKMEEEGKRLMLWTYFQSDCIFVRKYRNI